MKCPNCSSEVPETANVCGYCGHRLDKRPAAPPPNVPKKANSGMNWLWITLGIILILCVSVVCLVYGLPFLYICVSYGCW